MKLLKYYLFICLFVYLFISAFAPSAKALTMSGDNYTIQLGNFNMSSGKPTGPSNKLGFTMGQTGPGLYGTAVGDNYKVKSGFQYIHTIIPFSFTIDELFIDFGVLTATNPVTRSNDLTISNGSADGYIVVASESAQLADVASGALIPDTTCDDGSCTQETSAIWDNTLTYGFGYRCDNVTGTDCVSGFTDARSYKQFANGRINEAAQSVMSGANVGRNKKVRITYKVNISGMQPAGSYTNVITYIATPTF